jgi:hypothetical protein
MTNNNELKHVGVLGMHWGSRRGSGTNINFGGRHKRLGKAIGQNKKDIADLRKHGYKEEAKGLAGNNKAMAKKMAQIRAKKMHDLKTGEWSSGKKAVVGALVGVAAYSLTKFIAEGGAMRLLMKGAIG